MKRPGSLPDALESLLEAPKPAGCPQMALRRAPKPPGCPEACRRPEEALKYALKEALRPARGPEKPWKRPEACWMPLEALERPWEGGRPEGVLPSTYI